MSGVGVGGRLGVRTQPRARVAAPVPAVAERESSEASQLATYKHSVCTLGAKAAFQTSHAARGSKTTVY